MDVKTYRLDKNDINSFKETIFPVFNKYLQFKKKYIRANDAPFMIKKLHKVIMKRSKTKNKFLKSKSLIDSKNYKIQSNYSTKLFIANIVSDLQIPNIHQDRFYSRETISLYYLVLTRFKIT